jgi:2-haloacid dehalogenase
LAVDRLELTPEAISFQSSNVWDAYAASAFGMRVVWCNRYGALKERLPGAPNREVRTLAELPALLGASVSSDRDGTSAGEPTPVPAPS